MTILLDRASGARLEHLERYWRAANYLGAIQLYLKDNVLLEQPLRAAHVKERLLGHWGTQPGLNLIYAHLDRLIADTGARILLVVGPGHGAPAIYADLFLEGSLGHRYPEFSRNRAGVERLARLFSWPGGLPSHLSAFSPGALHEGGELGYSIAHAFGAALDNPDLIVACIVGDGEAETGPLAAAWQSNKFLNPASSGAVLPILHLNGYKLSGPALFARMSALELHQYFVGCGYDVRHIITDDDHGDAHRQLWSAMNWAYARIRHIQAEAREGRAIAPPAWPLIVLRTPKGWTGPRELHGRPIEGTFHSHQLPLPDPRGDPEQFAALEAWLRSYRPDELFDDPGSAAFGRARGHPAGRVAHGYESTRERRRPAVAPTLDPRICGRRRHARCHRCLRDGSPRGLLARHVPAQRRAALLPVDVPRRDHVEQARNGL